MPCYSARQEGLAQCRGLNNSRAEDSGFYWGIHSHFNQALAMVDDKPVIVMTT